jgi:TfoX/Sxy family transcriptional regulator of competence genes
VKSFPKKWKKTPPELVELLHASVAGIPCRLKPMFGYPVYFINDNMFIGTHQDTLFLRLSEKDRAALLRENHEAHPFEPLPGRVMKDYVVLPDSLYRDKEAFRKWLKRSLAYVGGLPVKKKKKGS